MINKIRKVILLITTILFACHLQVAGKEFFISEQSIPDFKFIFDKLSQNRITYNRYNDSIFRIHDHDEWVRFFMTRSRKNHQIYHENEKLLKSFEKVMGELREGAGTRYNPDLVKLIDDIPELYKELEMIAIYGWPDIYYKIYKNNMR